MRKDTVNPSYAYTVGDEIEIDIQNKKIIFQKRGMYTAVVAKIEFTEEEWNDSFLFVNLHKVGDSVAILN